ncbi:MAG: hypothetical protein NTW05_11680, partial [Pseudonocardiales bacterium]|nr:hypothetical protein [Pseudonocardiales bacterium]
MTSTARRGRGTGRGARAPEGTPAGRGIRRRGAAGAVLAGAVLAGLLSPGTAAAQEAPDPVPPVQVLTEDSTAVGRPDGTRDVTLYAGPVQLRRGA